MAHLPDIDSSPKLQRTGGTPLDAYTDENKPITTDIWKIAITLKVPYKPKGRKKKTLHIPVYGYLQKIDAGRYMLYFLPTTFDKKTLSAKALETFGQEQLWKDGGARIEITYHSAIYGLAHVHGIRFTENLELDKSSLGPIQKTRLSSPGAVPWTLVFSEAMDEYFKSINVQKVECEDMAYFQCGSSPPLDPATAQLFIRIFGGKPGSLYMKKGFDFDVENRDGFDANVNILKLTKWGDVMSQIHEAADMVYVSLHTQWRRDRSRIAAEDEALKQKMMETKAIVDHLTSIVKDANPRNTDTEKRVSPEFDNDKLDGQPMGIVMTMLWYRGETGHCEHYMEVIHALFGRDDYDESAGDGCLYKTDYCVTLHKVRHAVTHLSKTITPDPSKRVAMASGTASGSMSRSETRSHSGTVSHLESSGPVVPHGECRHNYQHVDECNGYMSPCKTVCGQKCEDIKLEDEDEYEVIENCENIKDGCRGDETLQICNKKFRAAAAYYDYHDVYRENMAPGLGYDYGPYYEYGYDLEIVALSVLTIMAGITLLCLILLIYLFGFCWIRKWIENNYNPLVFEKDEEEEQVHGV